MINVTTTPQLQLSNVCAPILLGLPDWFGIEEANQQYISDIDINPTFIASDNGTVVGFLTVTQHNPYSAEIHVMGIRREYHRRGIGYRLVTNTEAYLQSLGVNYLQVKTLSANHPDPYYAKTRAFYTACGFVPLQEFLTLWGESNPCLQLIKFIG